MTTHTPCTPHEISSFVDTTILRLCECLEDLSEHLSSTPEDTPLRSQSSELFQKLEAEILTWLAHSSLGLKTVLYRRVANTGSIKLLTALPARRDKEPLGTEAFSVDFMRFVGVEYMRAIVDRFVIGAFHMQGVIILAHEDRDWLTFLAEIDTNVISRHEMGSMLGSRQLFGENLISMIKDYPTVMPRLLARQISAEPSLGHRLINQLIGQEKHVAKCLPLLLSCGAELRFDHLVVRDFFDTHSFASNHERLYVSTPRQDIQALARTPWGVPGDLA